MFEVLIKDFSKTWSLHTLKQLSVEMQVHPIAILHVENHEGNVILICLN